MINTKFHRPRFAVDLIERTDLIEFLESKKDLPCTLVSAPAGFGKSVTVSQWLEKSKIQNAWISLDEEHNDFIVFLTYFLEAISSFNHEAISAIQLLLKSPSLPPESKIIEEVINGLDTIEEDFLLVLDDYHIIKDPKIHKLISSLIKYPPQSMHLVIIARHDPPLELSRLRTYGRVNELRMKQLAVSNKEVHSLVNLMAVKDMSNENVDDLASKMEGWVLGVRLSLLAFKSMHPNETTFDVEKLATKKTTFLFEKLMEKEDRDIYKILMIISIFKKFNHNLIDHLIISMNLDPGFTGKQLIEKWEHENLFIMVMDEERQFYRFHHLYQDFLQNDFNSKFQKEDKKKILSAAATWYLDKDMIEEAYECHLETNDFPSAVNILLESRNKLMISEQWHKLNRMMSRLPSEYLESNPLLLTTKAFYYEFKVDWPKIMGILEQLKGIIQGGENNNSQLYAEYMVLLSELSIIMSDHKSADEQSIEALKILDKDDYAWTMANYWLGLSLQLGGKSKEGIESLQLAIENKSHDEPSQLRLMIGICAIHFMDADLEKLKALATKTLKLGIQLSIPQIYYMSYYFLSCVCYFRKELDLAYKYANIVVKEKHLFGMNYIVSLCGIICMKINQLRDENKNAIALYEDLISYAEIVSDSTMSETLQCYYVDFLLNEGELEKANKLSQGLNFNLFPPAYHIYHRQITEVNLLEANGKCDEVLSKYEALISLGNAVHNDNFLVLVLAHKALFEFDNGNELGSIDFLHQSLSLAQKGSYQSPFFELPMKPLLEKYYVTKKDGFYVKTFLNGKKPATKSTTKGKDQTENEITQREIEVIDLICKGMRNKEIADQLFISTDTVKRHISNIYLKLEVHSRIQLAQKVKELDIITTTF